MFGHCVDRLALVPRTGQHSLLAFTAHNKVCISHTATAHRRLQIGVTLLPLDGNVRRHMAGIAHPEKISALAVSHDGNFVFSSGKDSAGVPVWQINPGTLAVSSHLAGAGLDPFLAMLEGASHPLPVAVAHAGAGGKTGTFLNTLEDYFYFAQVRAQGEDSMERRQVCCVRQLAR